MSLFFHASSSASPARTPRHTDCPKDLLAEPKVQSVKLRALRNHGVSCADALPLVVSVDSTSRQSDGRLAYNITVTSRATQRSWAVSFRFTQLEMIPEHIETNSTCASPKCAGSCGAIRQITRAIFPKYQLFTPNSKSTIRTRQVKLRQVFEYLMVCVTMPGSAMKCPHAQTMLPDLLYRFLNVTDVEDKRPVVHRYLDGRQPVPQSDPGQEKTECSICMDAVDLYDQASVQLGCSHGFHRACAATWLEKDLHCPICRRHVAPNAVANFCVVDKQSSQWWMTGLSD